MHRHWHQHQESSLHKYSFDIIATIAYCPEGLLLVVLSQSHQNKPFHQLVTLDYKKI